MRNYNYVVLTWTACTNPLYEDRPELSLMMQIHVILGSFLVVLCGMNFYWTLLMFKLLHKAVFKGVVEDTKRQYKGSQKT